jgi:hypothetical protein
LQSGICVDYTDEAYFSEVESFGDHLGADDVADGGHWLD